MGKRVNPMAVKAALTYEIGEAAAVLGVTSATIRNWIKDGLPVMKAQKPFLISGTAMREYLRAKNRAAKRPLDWNELYCPSCRAGRTPRDMAVTIAPITAKTSLLKGCCSECNATVARIISNADVAEWSKVFQVTKADQSEAYKTPPPLSQSNTFEGDNTNA